MARWKVWVEAILAGVVAGEITFSVIWGTAEDFWQHYYAANAIFNQIPIENYNYPAAAAFLFLPLALLPEPMARLIWLGLTYLIYIMAFRLFGFSRRNLLIWLAWPPVFVSAFAGQIDCIVLLSMSLAWAYHQRQRMLVSGAAMVLGLVKWHLLLPVAFLRVLKGTRQWLVGFLALTVIFAVVSVLLPQSYPGRINYILFWYLKNGRIVGIPARLVDLSLMLWLSAVIILGLAWVGIAVWNRRIALLALPLVHPYFLAFDLPVIVPVLEESKFILMSYFMIGVPSLWWAGGPYVMAGLALALLIELIHLFRQKRSPMAMLSKDQE